MEEDRKKREEIAKNKELGQSNDKKENEQTLFEEMQNQMMKETQAISQADREQLNRNIIKALDDHQKTIASNSKIIKMSDLKVQQKKFSQVTSNDLYLKHYTDYLDTWEKEIMQNQKKMTSAT